jgi:hypothetical protein
MESLKSRRAVSSLPDFIDENYGWKTFQKEAYLEAKKSRLLTDKGDESKDVKRFMNRLLLFTVCSVCIAIVLDFFLSGANSTKYVRPFLASLRRRTSRCSRARSLFLFKISIHYMLSQAK